VRAVVRIVSGGLTLALGVLAGGCSSGSGASSIEVTSTAFTDGGVIPERLSCEGDNVSPPLSWKGVPEDAVELAIVVRDPDAPDEPFFHWLVLGVDADATTIAEGTIPPGAVEAKGSSENATYIGMCPPNGEEHGYEFVVHALDRPIVAKAGPLSAPDVAALVDDHTIASGALVARFGR